jgi:glutamyl-Q tRNA(Asp) synthetase
MAASRLASRVPVPQGRSRFAPAPTGFLHLGHVVSAIYVWGTARAAGGQVLLRIEDHDRQRSRPEYERAILDDLDWLGFVPDVPDAPSTADCRGGPSGGRQSDRHEVYAAALADLKAKGLVYACECSRSEIASAGSGSGERRYPGTCARKNLLERPGLGMRVRLDRSIERFEDLMRGVQEQRPFEQCGDLLARDREGNWTYQFASAVDDHVQGITLVVRGDDLLLSTGRQIQLARLIGRTRPCAFLHHPLLMKTPSRKLSKSDGDSGVRDLRAQGWTPAQVIGRAATLIGLLDVERPVRADQVRDLV